MAEAPVLKSHQSNQRLICAVCCEVYQSPRILPGCLHSFCVTCLEALAKIHGSVIPCPTCKYRNRVPRAGVRGLQVNFYILEEDLERARSQNKKALCEIHHMEELLLYCLTCNQSICTSCRDNDHGTHDITNLGEVAALCREKLKSCRNNVDQTVSWLTNRIAHSKSNIDLARQEAETLKSLVLTRHDIFVASMIQQRNQRLRDLGAMASDVSNELNTYAIMVSSLLDSAVKMQQRVMRVLDITSCDDAKTVALEKEISDWHVGLMTEALNITKFTTRLGLQGQSDNNLMVQDVATLLYGKPLRLQQQHALPGESISPLCQNLSP